MFAAPRHLHQGQAAAIDESRGAAKHRIGALHGLHRDASSLTDGDTLADVEPRERIRDTAAVLDIGGLLFVRLAARHRAGGREQRLQEERRLSQDYALFLEYFDYAPDQAVRIARG